MNVEIEINFESLPTICEAWQHGMISKLSWLELILWPIGLWTSGRHHHVYFIHNDIAYHVSMLDGGEVRHKYNTVKPAKSFKIMVDEDNLLQAKLLVAEANRKLLQAPRRNCTHSISMLLFGRRHHFSTLGRYGWQTRKVLRAVEVISAAQKTL